MDYRYVHNPAISSMLIDDLCIVCGLNLEGTHGIDNNSFSHVTQRDTVREYQRARKGEVEQVSGVKYK